jgi:hypothetical protein
MDEQEARRLAGQIAGTPGWQALPGHNTWTGAWYVTAWQGRDTEEPEDSYTLHYRVEWHRLRQGLAEEGGE